DAQGRAVIDIGVVAQNVAGDRGGVLGHGGGVVVGHRRVVDARDRHHQVGAARRRAVGGVVAEAVGDRGAGRQVLDAGRVERVGVAAVGRQPQAAVVPYAPLVRGDAQGRAVIDVGVVGEHVAGDGGG